MRKYTNNLPQCPITKIQEVLEATQADIENAASPVTRVSSGISSMMHFSVCCAKSKYIAEVKLTKNATERYVQLEFIVVTFNIVQKWKGKGMKRTRWISTGVEAQTQCVKTPPVSFVCSSELKQSCWKESDKTTASA